MAKILKYGIYKNLKLVIEYFEGNIYLYDIINLKTQQSKNKDYNRNYNVIADFRKAELKIAQTQYNNVTTQYNENCSIRDQTFIDFETKWNITKEDAKNLNYQDIINLNV